VTNQAIALSALLAVACDPVSSGQVGGTAESLQHAQLLELETREGSDYGELLYGDDAAFSVTYELESKPTRPPAAQTFCPLPCTLEDLENIMQYVSRLQLFDAEVRVENRGDWPVVVEYTLEATCETHLYLRSQGTTQGIESESVPHFRSFELAPGGVYDERFTCGDSSSLAAAKVNVRQVAIE
jgi:hypothetical protein